MAVFIEHVALWTQDLERSKNFYVKYFKGVSNAKYVNSSKGFESYFISFGNGGRLELMKKVNIHAPDVKDRLGYAHIAFGFPSKEKVDALTEVFRIDGYEIAGEPRTTGDGYYESIIKDPDGNLIELVVAN
jgi:lactoylglutathione lyase